MRISFKKGLGFGSTSGIITTLGLIVGINSSTHSFAVVASSILVISIADAMSDALGIHISEEFEGKHSIREIWEATISTFLSKFIFALSFLVPVILLPLSSAVVICVIWGLGLIVLFSYYMAKQQNIKPHKVVLEHLVITILVITTTYYIGDWIAAFSN